MHVCVHLFPANVRFPKSVCNALIDGLDSRLLPIFRRNYPEHSVIHDLGATYQRSKFQEILGAMQMAEDKVNSISKIARSTVNSQAFHSNVLVNASQAERTLSRYGGGEVPLGWRTFHDVERVSWSGTARLLLRMQRTPSLDQGRRRSLQKCRQAWSPRRSGEKLSGMA